MVSEKKKTVDQRASFDSVKGIIRLDASKFWAPEDIDPILDRLADLVAVARTGSRPAHVLVDFGAVGAQKADTVDRVRRRSRDLYLPGDRLAIVLESKLLKMQVSRVDRTIETRVFADPTAAEKWLQNGVSDVAEP